MGGGQDSNIIIGVSVKETDTYASASCIISVTFLAISTVLDENSWAKIHQISEINLGDSIWSVGDVKEISISINIGVSSQTIGSYFVYILGFNHNSSVEGEGITFGGFKTAKINGIDVCLTDHNYGVTYSLSGRWFNMEHSGGSTQGGWAACDTRYDLLGSTNVEPKPYGTDKAPGASGGDPTDTCTTNPVKGTLMEGLETELRAVMKAVTKYTDNVGGGKGNLFENITATKDYLFFLSEFEVFGTITYGNIYEKNYQKQYAYFVNGNPVIKYKHGSTSTAAAWWLRSPCRGSNGYFLSCNPLGNSDDTYSNQPYGIAPAFVV